MENPIEDQTMEEWAVALLALALQQPGHNVSTLSLTFQRVFRLRDSQKIKPKSLRAYLLAQCLLSCTQEAHSLLPRGCSQRAQDSGEDEQ